MNTTTTAPAAHDVQDRYDDQLLVSEARDRYLSRYGLDGGGYEDDWTFTWVGWVPVVVPNTPARKKALRAHDLHHVATGCNAVWKQGEIDVAAYELRAGGPGRFGMGWWIIPS